MKKLICALAVISFLLSIASCGSPGVAESSHESSQAEASSREDSVAETDDMAAFIAGYAHFTATTETPVIVDNLTVSESRVVISGSCEAGSVVYLAADGRVRNAVVSDEGRFIIETAVRRADSPLNALIYARAEGKAVSEGIETTLKYTCNGEYPAPDIVRMGSEGWLFFTNTEPQYTNNEPMSSRRKNRVIEKTTERVAALADHGIKLVYVLVPNPNEIYPEYMPDEIVRGSVNRREEVAEVLRSGGATVIDMKNAISALKSGADGASASGELELYHHTDSHWTEYSAYFAYKALCDMFVADGFTDSAARDINEFGFANEYRAAGDLYYDLGMDEYAFWVNSTFSHITFDTPVDLPKYSAEDRSRINDNCMEYMEFHNENGADKPSFVMMRDSYSIMLFDWLSERCDASYFKPLWEFGLDIDDAVSKGVDYVIYFITDMNLDNITK